MAHQPIRGLIPDWFIELNQSFFTGFTSIMVPKCELDNKYPHFCFRCKKPLKFKELIIANTTMDEDYLEELWKSEVVEFYCCECFRREKYEKSIRERIEEYMREAARRRGVADDFEIHWETGLRGMKADEIWVDEAQNIEFGYDIAEK